MLSTEDAKSKIALLHEEAAVQERQAQEKLNVIQRGKYCTLWVVNER
jgi:hypothetical protein